jgi:hypothetical protein
MLQSAEHAHVVLVSASGFTRSLVTVAAERADVHLVDLEDVYAH